MKIELPHQVKFIIESLQRAGFQAYAVGGCVRDSILHRTPDDWDITTSAKPQEVKKLFRRTIDTGIKHGTVTVLMDQTGYEVTTYRIDGEYEDGRHPKEVTFTACLSEDLLRRDFTINAMAYNDSEGLIDIFEGVKDIKKGLIRCVGNPMERFTEDALRIMRAVRFAAQLGYEIEDKTKEAMFALSGNLVHVSAERIQVELVKTIVSPHPYLLKEAYVLGITGQVLPEFNAAMETPQNNPHHCYSVGEHILHSMEAVREDRVLRLTMLFHDIAKPVMKTTDTKGIDHFAGHAKRSEEMANTILRRLKFDTDTIMKVSRLVRSHDYRIEPGLKNMRHAIAQIGEDAFPMLFEVQRADMEAQSDYQKQDKINRLDVNIADYKTIIEQKQCISRAMLAVKGSDLIKEGMKPGKEIGEVIDAMLADVLKEPTHNEKEYLLAKFCRRQ